MPIKRKKPDLQLNLRKAIIRSVASSTAIETGRSIAEIEQTLVKLAAKPNLAKAS